MWHVPHVDSPWKGLEWDKSLLCVLSFCKRASGKHQIVDQN